MPIEITDAEKKLLATITIPPRPEVLLTLSSEAKQPEPDVSKIAHAITEDISISSAVLQVVNSAAFRRASEIKSIDQAVMILGFKRIFPLVKAVALRSSLSQSQTLAEFWQQQTDIAHACSIAAKAMGKPALGDHAYMLGLFNSAGIPVMAQSFADYSEVMAQAEQQGWSECLPLELDRYQTTHTTIGALLAQRWSLPKVMISVIYYLHEVDDLYTSGELDNTGLDLLTLLKLARSAVYYPNDYSNDPEWQLVCDQIMDHYGYAEVQVDEIFTSIQEGLEEHRQND
ncbi:MAG: HDOD domain-containing protein [Halopseudomonas sp.]